MKKFRGGPPFVSFLYHNYLSSLRKSVLFNYFPRNAHYVRNRTIVDRILSGICTCINLQNQNTTNVF